jgi:tetratricopeptide (TPR) repeat protein
VNADIAKSLQNLGGVCDDEGDHKGAREYYEQALAMQRRVHGVEAAHADIASAHYNISSACEDADDIDSAIEHMQQAYACYVECFGADHDEAVDAQEEVERLEEVQRSGLRSSEELLVVYKEKLKLAQQSKDTKGQASAHYNISSACEDADDIDSAIEHMQQAYACYVECFGADHDEAVDAQEEVERLQRGGATR